MITEEIRTVLDVLKQKRRLDLSHYDIGLTSKSIEGRLSRLGLKSPRDYGQYLAENDDEIDSLLKSLTINVSAFFRDPLVFDFIFEKVLPEICFSQDGVNHNTIRVWSAGCANGEEAYSMAILLKRFISQNKLDIDFQVFATDIDTNALGTSQDGVYHEDSLRNIRYADFKEYFEGSGCRFEVKKSITDAVEFSYHDLTDSKNYAPASSVFGNFDIVLCRNVLIYFAEASQNQILSNCIKSLKPNGFLVLGETELPTVEANMELQQVVDICRIYKKI